MSLLKKLFKLCFSSLDVNETQCQQPPKPTIVSSTASLTSTEKSPVKVIATPTVTEISTALTQQALTVVAKHTYHLNPSFPMPEIQNGDEVLIRNCAIGLNPIDWKSVDWNFCLPAFPWVTGREMAGIVEHVGENVTGLTVGDRVWTSTYYRDIRSGCFQQYVIAPTHTIQHIPPNLSFEQGACLGVCGLTAAMTIWRWLEAPIHNIAQPIFNSNPRYILIWGGSSITGQFAIQIALYSGLEVIAVASARTKDLVSELGVRHVITRDNKTNFDIVAEIRAIAGDNLTLAIDMVGPETAACCLSAFPPPSSNITCKFAPLSFLPKGYIPAPNVEVKDVEMKWFILDKANEEYAIVLNQLVGKGVVKVPELDILEGGLGRVEEGLEMQKRGDRGGRKIIVSLRR